jgi:predicted ATP-grasp superfamily ATP-dependent carboligase
MTALIVAVSGRALAAAARRAGEPVLVADFFGDVDTRALAPWIRLPGDLAGGIEAAGLGAMLRQLPQPIDAVVYGAGLERDPDLLEALAAVAPLRGNTAATVATVKDERRFAALLARLGLPHPEIAARPARLDGWLRKERGGSGGTHVQDAPGHPAEAGGRSYFQKRARGTPVSALFVANGSEARIIGFSEQWTAPAAAAPFRYGGCAGPLALAPRLAAEIAEACSALTIAAGLVGLNSLDLLIAGDAFTVLELNPRPGATLDLFDAPPLPPLWRWHRDGAAGRLPAAGSLAMALPPRAAAVVYAPRPLRVPRAIAWPGWVSDRPPPLSTIDAEEPVCTVLAAGDSVAAARAAAAARADAILRALEPASSALPESA